MRPSPIRAVRPRRQEAADLLLEPLQRDGVPACSCSSSRLLFGPDAGANAVDRRHRGQPERRGFAAEVGGRRLARRRAARALHLSKFKTAH